MCTVTYFPLKNNFIFTSNRDESPLRAVNQIEYENGFYFPRDPKASGTWFVLEKDMRLRCLLNGAFVRHQHEPPYKLSRGILVLESMQYPTLKNFAKRYDFNGIEPFTLIEVQFDHGLNLSELRWDGKELFYMDLDPKTPRIWSSAPLYSPDTQLIRKTWFEEFIQEKDFSPESIFAFHTSKKGPDDTINFMMHRAPGPSTISTTQYVHESQTLSHINHLTGELIASNL
jgi:hypothetical protein